MSNTDELDITVAIPTYNGATRLPAVLDRLKKQIEVENIAWEVLVVDNNSTDNLKEVVQSYENIGFNNLPIRYCLETQQGAAFARIKAIKEARGRLVGFLDDDTLPALNWLKSAYLFGCEHPQAGAYGSQIHGNYEVEPPENFHRIASFFAITERGNQAHIYHPQMKMLPPSAGLVVRRKAWLENVPDRPFLSGRSGQSILNSEDLEAILYIQNANWEIWYNPDMEIEHQIPRDRLTKDYLIFLMKSTGLARHHIRMLRYKPWQKLVFFPLGWGNDIRKALTYFITNRQVLDKDIVAACEMEFLRSSIISPFYLWRQSLQKKT
ncbi:MULTISPECIES: hormogonium polysaccharide biosynthesis glycosyltransferase HpsE [Spirulina sp. CCY15215]|uniref:hormogonium polysaccharide biosynthesis glycosyltransferase HpsE n=1 Tax=Spirulina sp. CCY15215 TaxID=2767591 RepID=UPI0019524EA6|nr:hormogonium polysaccharide biosynthesis glycosyltransferase HpsE [Spirulina major]